MPLVTKVRDLMIPLSDYAVVNVNDALGEAALCLRKVYCEAQTGSCTEAGHRSALVLDDKKDLVGILDFKSILRVFIPEIAGAELRQRRIGTEVVQLVCAQLMPGAVFPVAWSA